MNTTIEEHIATRLRALLFAFIITVTFLLLSGCNQQQIKVSEPTSTSQDIDSAIARPQLKGFGKRMPKPETVMADKEKPTTTSPEAGMIVYRVPDSMVILHQYTAIVRISKGSIDSSLITDGLESHISAHIKTADKVTVTLVDASDTSLRMFEVNPITDEQQVLEYGNSYTEWQFAVIPKRSGHGVLRLVVSIPKKDGIKQIVYTDNIRVKSDVNVEFWDFFLINWKWIVSICIMPLVTLFLKWGFDRITKSKEDKGKA